MERKSWLLLLYGLPTESKAARISLWRKLKKFGAVQFKTSVYVLPDEPSHFERFQWLAKQVRDGGGEATLMQVSKIEGVSDGQMIERFNRDRSGSYKALTIQVKALLDASKQKRVPDYFPQLEKLKRQFQEIRDIDYFTSPASHDAEMALSQAAKRFEKVERGRPALKRKCYQNCQWLTRPRPEIDRVGSAWLIKTFLDPRAAFVFSLNARDFPNAIPYDMNDTEFTHQGEDCTFETLLKRFHLTDKRLHAIAEMIHDADLEDEKFRRAECVGLDRVLKGFGAMGCKDNEILSKGFEMFQALYAITTV